MALSLYDKVYLPVAQRKNYPRILRPIDELAEDLERWWRADL